MAKNAYAWGKMKKKKKEPSPGHRILNEFRAKQKKIAHKEKKKTRKLENRKKAKKAKKEWYQKQGHRHQ
jgi:hypothetical protein